MGRVKKGVTFLLASLLLLALFSVIGFSATTAQITDVSVRAYTEKGLNNTILLFAAATAVSNFNVTVEDSWDPGTIADKLAKDKINVNVVNSVNSPVAPDGDPKSWGFNRSISAGTYSVVLSPISTDKGTVFATFERNKKVDTTSASIRAYVDANHQAIMGFTVVGTSGKVYVKLNQAALSPQTFSPKLDNYKLSLVDVSGNIINSITHTPGSADATFTTADDRLPAGQYTILVESLQSDAGFVLLDVVNKAPEVSAPQNPGTITAVGPIGILAKGACTSPGDIILYLSDSKNSHAYKTAGANDYALCYSSKAGYNTNQILKASDKYKNSCIFSNEVLSLSSESNAHVEGPNANTYNYPVCYGHLECRVSDSETPLAGEQVLATLSANTDSHLSVYPEASSRFNRFLMCREPICDDNSLLTTAARTPSVYPLISGFDSPDDNLSATTTGGAFASVSIEQKYTGMSSLKISYPMSDLNQKSVNLTLGNKGNWSGYNYLEFYVYVPKSLGMFVKITSNDGKFFSFPISTDYAPFGIIRNRFNLIQIPLDRVSESVPINNLASISFEANPMQVLNFLQGDSSVYDYYVDSIQLSSDYTEGDFAKYYCEKKLDANGNSAFSWQTQLTMQKYGYNRAWLKNAAGDFVENTTSGKICGEQPYETYADGQTGCYNSIFVKNNTPIDFLYVPGMTYSKRSQICAGNSCRSFVSPWSDSSDFSIDRLKPFGNNFELSSYDVQLRSGISNSTATPFGNENIVSYSLVKPRVVYGSQLTFNSTDGLQSADSPNFYSCGDISEYPDQYSNGVVGLTIGSSSDGDKCVTIGSYSCSQSGFFIKQTGSQPVTSYVSSSFPGTDEPKGCCAKNECFGNGACRPDQTKSPSSASFGNTTEKPDGYRCFAGVWKETKLKQNYDGSKEGYCSDNSQCLVTNNPLPGKEGCINSGKFYQNYYCAADANGVGTWTSRTAILAGQMIEYAQTKGWDQGTLYCDDYNKTLNFVDTAQKIPDVFKGTLVDGKRLCAVSNSDTSNPVLVDNEFSCVNSFCVFSPNEDEAQPVFGTSLNLPYINVTNINRAFVDSCVNVDNNTDGFGDCSDSSYKYDPKLQLVLYNPNPTSLWQGVANLWTKLKNLFSDTPALDEKFRLAQDSKSYTRFYFTDTPTVSITAFNERRYNSTLLAGKNFYVFKIVTAGASTVNLCNDLVVPYNKQKGTSATCARTEILGGLKVQTIINGDSEFALEGLWSALTSNLRIS